MDWILELLVIVLFLFLKGFFSGSEIAMVNSDKLKLRHQAKMGDKGAGMVLEAIQNPRCHIGHDTGWHECSHSNHLNLGSLDIHRFVWCQR